MSRILKTSIAAAALFATASINGSLSINAEGLRTELSAPVTFTLPGDARQSSVTANWENDLNNGDANENQMSMAVSGDYLYVCIAYFTAGNEKNSNLFLRRYSLADGSETEILIPVPADFRQGNTSANNYYTIVSDDSGNLIAALLQTTPKYDGTLPKTSSSARLTLYRVDTQTNTIDETSRCAAEISDLNIMNVGTEGALISDMTWLERINWHSGDFLAGDFEFSTCLGWCTDGNNDYDYAYLTFSASGENRTMGYNRNLTLDKTYANSSKLSSPDVACYPAVPQTADNLIVTYNGVGDQGQTPVDKPSVLYLSGEKTSEFAKAPNCRGFFPFMHNGHVMVAYATVHDTASQKAQFSVSSWEAKNSFDGLKSLASLPQTPFNPVNYIYEPRIRQLAVAVPEHTAARAESDAVRTDLYLCAPGSGVASYTISTPLISTEIETPADEANPEVTLMSTDGKLIITGATDGSALELYDLSGRLVLTTPADNGSEISFPALAAGIYVARVGSLTQKIEIR